MKPKMGFPKLCTLPITLLFYLGQGESLFGLVPVSVFPTCHTSGLVCVSSDLQKDLPGFLAFAEAFWRLGMLVSQSQPGQHGFAHSTVELFL